MIENCEDRLKNLAAEYEEFAYIVSHDLKAPVRAISNLAGWIEEDLKSSLSEEDQQNLNLLKNRTTRLTKMIEALLEFSRVNRRHLDVEEVNLEPVIKDICVELQSKKPFKLQLTGSAPAFKTFSEKLNCVVRELLKNALYFNNAAKPEIIINLQTESAGITITIADNGPGVPEEALQKVFTIFYTLQNKDQSDTTGAGLAIVNKIINFVKGNIQLKNRPEGGFQATVFWPFELPEITKD